MKEAHEQIEKSERKSLISEQGMNEWKNHHLKGDRESLFVSRFPQTGSHTH